MLLIYRNSIQVPQQDLQIIFKFNESFSSFNKNTLSLEMHLIMATHALSCKRFLEHIFYIHLKTQILIKEHG